jgi:peptidoglycan/xylan/chitin deacetylase (PgdA/CDA1 family)
MTTGSGKRIALSFDDVPRSPGPFLTPDERTAKLIDSLAAGGVEQAVFFVTTGNLERPYGAGGERRIAAYVEAGHVIANHSHGHRPLSRTDPALYLADIDRAEAWLSAQPGHRPWFRFAFLDEGAGDRSRRDAVRHGLAERGLANGYITVDSYDWFLEDLAGRSLRSGRPVDRDALGRLYTELIVRAAEFAERLARETLGRSPAHVMLLHETDLAALFIDQAAAALREAGWEIVPIDEAYRDPLIDEEPDASYLAGGRIAAIANARGRPPRQLLPEWNDERMIQRLFNERVLGTAVPA